MPNYMFPVGLKYLLISQSVADLENASDSQPSVKRLDFYL